MGCMLTWCMLLNKVVLNQITTMWAWQQILAQGPLNRSVQPCYYLLSPLSSILEWMLVVHLVLVSKTTYRRMKAKIIPASQQLAVALCVFSVWPNMSAVMWLRAETDSQIQAVHHISITCWGHSLLCSFRFGWQSHSSLRVCWHT